MQLSQFGMVGSGTAGSGGCVTVGAVGKVGSVGLGCVGSVGNGVEGSGGKVGSGREDKEGNGVKVAVGRVGAAGVSKRWRAASLISKPCKDNATSIDNRKQCLKGTAIVLQRNSKHKAIAFQDYN